MDFFEKLFKKTTDTYKCMEEKTNKMAVESKIKSKMNDCKSKINAIYNEIGKKVYQKHTTDGLVEIKEDLQEELSKIDELCNEIENCELELLNLAGQKKCTNCEKTIQIDANYCPSCGVKQSIIEEKQNEDENNKESDATDVKTETIEIEQFVEEVEPIENAEESATGENQSVEEDK